MASMLAATAYHIWYESNMLPYVSLLTKKWWDVGLIYPSGSRTPQLCKSQVAWVNHWHLHQPRPMSHCYLLRWDLCSSCSILSLKSAMASCSMISQIGSQLGELKSKQKGECYHDVWVVLELPEEWFDIIGVNGNVAVGVSDPKIP